MKMRPGTIAAATVTILIGLAIGAWLAIVSRGSGGHPTPITIAGSSRAPATESTRAVNGKPPAAYAAPSAAVRRVMTTQVATGRAAGDALGGSWQLEEANVQVGTIVWVADAVRAGGDTIVLDAHKQSVGGRSATPCERQTALHAAFSIGVAQQSVPYRETNCQGTVSTGEIRIQSFSTNDGSFSGTFWQSGIMLGPFYARKR